MRTKHGRVNKIVARGAVYYPPPRSPCVCVGEDQGPMTTRARPVPTWGGTPRRLDPGDEATVLCREVTEPSPQRRPVGRRPEPGGTRGRQGQMDGRTEGCGSLAWRLAASGESPDEINTVILLVASDKRRRLVGLSRRLAVEPLLSAEARLSS